MALSNVASCAGVSDTVVMALIMITGMLSTTVFIFGIVVYRTMSLAAASDGTPNAGRWGRGTTEHSIMFRETV